MFEILVNGMLITVKVENQWILLPIGWYPEELITKTELVISVTIEYQLDRIQDDLSNTVDYQLISEQILALKNKEFKLLEFAAQALLENIENNLFRHVEIRNVFIEFKKKNIAHEGISAEFHTILVEKNYPNP